MLNSKFLLTTQELYGRVRSLAEALAVEKAAAELGTSPFWIGRQLRQRGLSLKTFVASDEFKSLKRWRAASKETRTVGPPYSWPQTGRRGGNES
jgi:hypothetical protein